MTPLQSLKQILQEHLEVCQEEEYSDDYAAALEDALYGTDLSEIGIIEWCGHWLKVSKTYTEEDTEYVRGVQFVNDQWNIIKEKEDES